jgi:AcrR family transcriptional regulator
MLYEKLSPGPGKLPREVSSHQLTRLRGALIEIAGEDGYGAVTVRRLTQRAGVSTRSFYEHFDDKDGCFLNTYEWLVRNAARGMMGSQKAGRDWRQRLRLGLWRFTRDLAAEPKAAHLLLLDAFAVGPPALEPISHAEAIFDAVVNSSLARAPKEEMSPPFAARAIVSGVTRVARVRLLAGRIKELPAVADELMEWACSFACGAAEVADPFTGPLESELETVSELGPTGGRKDPTREQSRRGPRALVLAAVAKLAASEGYEALSPPRIRAAAGVSRKAFEAHFVGVHDCYLTAVEVLSTEAISVAEQEGARAKTWPTAFHRAVAVLCERIAQDRTFARLTFVGGVPPGPTGIRLRERLIAIAVEWLRRSIPSACRPSELAAEASVAAAYDAIKRQVAAGHISRPARQAEQLTFLLLAPSIGGPAAIAAVQDAGAS